MIAWNRGIALATLAALTLGLVAPSVTGSTEDFEDWARERRAFLEKDAFFSKLPSTTILESAPFLLHVSGPPVIAALIRDEIAPLLDDQRRYFETAFVEPGRLVRRVGFEGFTISVIADRKTFERHFADRQFEMRAEGLVARYDHRHRILVLCTDGTGTRLSPDQQRHQTLKESGRFLLDAYSPRGILSVIAHWQRVGIPDHLAEARPIQVAGRTRHRFGEVAGGRMADLLVGVSGSKPLVPLADLTRVLDDWALEGTTREAARESTLKDRRLLSAQDALLRWGPAAYHTFVGFLMKNEPWKSRFTSALSELLSADYTADRFFERLKTEPADLETAWLTWVQKHPEIGPARAAADRILSAPPPISRAANTQADPFSALRKRDEKPAPTAPTATTTRSPLESLAAAIRALRAGSTVQYLQLVNELGPAHQAHGQLLQAFRERFLTAVVKQSTLLDLTIAGDAIRGTVTARQGDELLLDLRGGGQRRVPTEALSWDELVVLARSRLKWREGEDYLAFAAVHLALGDLEGARKTRSSARRKDADIATLEAVWSDYERAAAAVVFENQLAEAQGSPAAWLEVFTSTAADKSARDILPTYVARHRNALRKALIETFDATEAVRPLVRGQVEPGPQPGTVRVRYDFSTPDQGEDWKAYGAAHLMEGWDHDFSNRSAIEDFRVEGGQFVADRISYVRHSLRLMGPASLEWKGRIDEYDDTSQDLLMLAFYGILCDEGTNGDFYAFTDSQLVLCQKGWWRGRTEKVLPATIGTQYHDRVEWTGEKVVGVRDKRKRVELGRKEYSAGYTGFFVFGDFRYRIDDVVIEGRPDPKLIEKPLEDWIAARLKALTAR